MIIFKFLWWLGGPLFALACIGYGIAFIGWGFSWWQKPEPDAAITCVAFLCAGAQALRISIEEATDFLNGKSP